MNHSLRVLAQRSRVGFFVTLAVLVMIPQQSGAQDRLVATRVLAVGGVVDVIGFGNEGFRQPGVMGLDSTRIKGISQFSVPVSMAFPVGTQWTVDMQVAYTASRLKHATSLNDGSEIETTTTLAGPTDIRLRATGRLLDDAVVITAGVNAPTGKTGLGAGSLMVLRASAAPALGLSAAPVGTGASGTAGIVLAHELGGWAVAVGGSYEVRGSYQPIASIVAGAPSVDLEPGHVVRGSVGMDRLVGRHRLSIAGAVDVYSNDVLRSSAEPASAPPLSTLRFGPIYSIDAQLQLGVPSVREFVVWIADRVRTPLSRDGATVTGTSGNYFDAGIRTSVPVSSYTDILLAVDSRLHSGLELNQGLATAAVTSGGVTAGLIRRSGAISFQPYVRAQAGRLRPRGPRSSENTSFTGVSAGLVVVTRF